MSDPQLSLPIKSAFDATGTDAALKALRQLQQEQAKAAPKSGGGGDPFKGVSQSAQAAERDTLRYASAMAQAQRATGDTAGSVETMRAALAQMTPNTVEAHQATVKLSQAQNALQKELSGVGDYARQTGAAVVSSLQAMIGPAALAGAAIGAISKGAELIQLGAQAQQTKTRFDALAASAGTTGDALLKAMRSASGGTISDLNLQLAANRAQLLGVAHSAQEFSTLMEIARARAQDMGISTTQAFNDLVTGLGRGSRLILDNLGIIVSETAANEAYAKAIGKTTAQLSDAEKKQALINAVLAQGKASLEATGGAAETAAAKLEKASAGIDNMKAALGGLLALKAGPLAEDVANLANALAGVGDAAEGLKSTASLSSAIGSAMGSAFDPVIGTISKYNELVLNGAAAAVEWAGATDQQAAAAAASASGFDTQRAAVQAAADVQAAQAVQVTFTTAAIDTQLQSMGLLSMATQDATLASMADAAAKDEQTAKTDLLRAETENTVAAFIALHPNISASEAASIAAASGMSPLIVRLIEARIRADDARAALAAFNALAGIKAAAVGTGIASRADADELKNDQIRTRNTVNQAAATKRYNDQLAAERDRITAVGTAQQRVALAESDLAAARAKYGANSAEAYRAETQLMQARERAAKGGRAGGGRAGAGGAGGGRASAAETTATRLQDIERTSGNKIAEIDEQTQEKILAIEKKYADQRAQQQRDLMDEIARTNAETNYDQQLNDFDKFNKDLTDEQRAAIADREKAETEYNAKVAQYQEEARQQAQNGDAQLAEDTLKARTEQAKKEKEIQERAAEARRQGGKAGDVQREAQEATDAARQQADTEIAIAQAKAQERAAAEQQEKDNVIAQAEEQKQKVIAAAEESASKVKGASDSQKATVIANLRAQADAVKAWADQIESDSARAGRAMGGVHGPPAPGAPGEGGDTGGEGGGGPPPGPSTQGMSLRVGGRSLSSAGGGSVESAIATLNDAAEIIKVLKPFVASNKGAVKLLNEYSLTVKAAVGSLIAIQDLRNRLVQPAPVLDPRQVERLKADVEYVVKTMVAVDASATNKVKVLAKYLELEKAAVEILTTVLDLRDKLGTPTPPINQAYVKALVAESAQVVSGVLGQVPRMVQREIELLKSYRDSSGAAISILNDTADLAKTLAEPQPAIPSGSIRRLAQITAQTTRVVLSLLVPLTQSETDALTRYHDAALAAAEVLTSTAELPETLAKVQPAIPFGSIKRLAELAKQVLRVVSAVMVPTAQDTVDALQRYTDTAGAAISLIKDAAELPEVLAKARPAVPVGAIQAIAKDAQRITDLLLKTMLPISEEQAAAAQRYADTTGAGVEVLKDTLGLTANMFADYRSPSDAQLDMVVADADRIAKRLNAAAAKYSTEGLEAAKAYGESLGSIFSAFKEQLLFAQALDSGDFILDPKRLAKFEAGGMQIIAVAGRLGGAAAALPAGNLGALNAVSDAISAQSDMWLKLASVPFGNLSSLSQSAGGQSGGGSNVTIMPGAIVINGAGQNGQQIATTVIGRLNQLTAMRRA